MSRLFNLYQSQRFAASLMSMGMKRGDRMAFMGANHMEWLVALYACMQLGVIPVSLNINRPFADMTSSVGILLAR